MPDIWLDLIYQTTGQHREKCIEALREWHMRMSRSAVSGSPRQSRRMKEKMQDERMW